MCAAGCEPIISIGSWQTSAMTTGSPTIPDVGMLKDHVETEVKFFVIQNCSVTPPPQPTLRVSGRSVGGSTKIPGWPIYPPPPQYHEAMAWIGMGAGLSILGLPILALPTPGVMAPLPMHPWAQDHRVRGARRPRLLR